MSEKGALETDARNVGGVVGSDTIKGRDGADSDKEVGAGLKMLAVASMLSCVGVDEMLKDFKVIKLEREGSGRCFPG